jgi:hypothetical protein
VADEAQLLEQVQALPGDVVGGEVELRDLLGGEDPVLIQVEKDGDVSFLDAMHHREDRGVTGAGAKRNATGTTFRGCHSTTPSSS